MITPSVQQILEIAKTRAHSRGAVPENGTAVVEFYRTHVQDRYPSEAEFLLYILAAVLDVYEDMRRHYEKS